VGGLDVSGCAEKLKDVKETATNTLMAANKFRNLISSPFVESAGRLFVWFSLIRDEKRPAHHPHYFFSGRGRKRFRFTSSNE
jgi:hypothetical protein